MVRKQSKTKGENTLNRVQKRQLKRILDIEGHKTLDEMCDAYGLTDDIFNDFLDKCAKAE